jgi:hypothetical protein
MTKEQEVYLEELIRVMFEVPENEFVIVSEDTLETFKAALEDE